MKTVFELMSSFAKDKMKQRFILSSKGDLTKLIEDVGVDILPAEYGGTNGSIQDHIGKKHGHFLVISTFNILTGENSFTDALRKHLKTNRNFLLEMSKYRANEKKRPGKSKTHSDLFGMEGSFRQLDFD